MIVAGTGHRPDKLGGYTREAKDKLIKLAQDYLKEAKPDKVISGMALGWDNALGWAAVRLGIPLIAAVPFKGQERMWPQESKDNFEALLYCAEEVVYVSEGGYAPWKMQVRNKWMVDNCDVVLAIWNGTDGGTANCVKYAESVGKPIVNLWEAFDAQPQP